MVLCFLVPCKYIQKKLPEQGASKKRPNGSFSFYSRCKEAVLTFPSDKALKSKELLANGLFFCVLSEKVYVVHINKVVLCNMND